MGPVDLSGQVLDGRYRIIGPIGKGAMGSVYRAERLKLGRIVAVKVMNEHVPNELSSRRRFEREAMAMAKLEHPHCAAVVDVGIHDDKPFVVMEFIDGQDLHDVINQGPMPVPRAAEIVRQILSGLAHAHEHGVVHRDIKAANIVLSQKSGLGDHAKILDFGLARMNQETSNITAGFIVGTPSYMAPEQVRGLVLDGRTDLYACGVLLFELVTGVKPFRAGNNDPLAVCMMQLNVPPPRLADALPGHDFGALEAVVARALEKDREKRFATAGEFAAAITEAVGYPTRQTPVPFVAPVRAATPIPDDFGSAATSALPSSQLVPLPPVVPPVVPSPPEPTPAVVALQPQPAPPVLPERTASVPARSSRRGILIGGGLAAVAAIVVVILATQGGAKPVVPAPPPVPVANPADPPVVVPAGPDAVADLVAQALELAGQGRHKSAIDLLVKARRTYPKDARLPYQAGKLYLSKMWWGDGLGQARAALELDPEYRKDPELIKVAIRGFITTARYDATIANFLRNDIGEAVKPYLEETAKSHPNPIIRSRATAELRRYP